MNVCIYTYRSEQKEYLLVIESLLVAMDSVYGFHYLIYLILMPLAFLFSSLILPPYFLYILINNIFGWFYHENMNGKVVLITGASSGIGEHMTYDYAKRGARLVIVARRQSRLIEVAEMARQLGSPDVLPLCADVSNIKDCKRVLNEAITSFQRLDHLVINAGISSAVPFEHITNVTKCVSIMEINFWGAIYPTHFAIPHLRRSKGRIIVISSGAAMMHLPRMSFYCASKAAVISFFEVLRVELSPDIKISIVTPGFIDSEMTQGKLLAADGTLRSHPEVKDIIPLQVLIMSAKTGANAIVRAICRGERMITEPKWCKVFFMLNIICLPFVDWCLNLHFNLIKSRKPA